MKKEEKNALKDVIGMLSELVGKEEEQPTSAEDKKQDEQPDDEITEEELEFVKNMVSEELRGIVFVGLDKDGYIDKGAFSNKVWNAMLAAFIERYG